MPLDEIRGGRADGDNQVGWLISVEGVKIIDKWSFRFVIYLAGHSQASGPENPRAFESAYLGANGCCIIGPWLEAETERMQHQNAFGLWISRLTLAQRRQQ